MRRQTGLTLLEVLLVLVISMGLVYLSIQQYLSFRRDADIQEVRYNVDIIFQALAKYFRAHCRSDTNFNAYNSSGTIAVPMNTLVSEGFLTASIALNPIVNSGGPGGGYVMQFNQYQEGGALPARKYPKTVGGLTNYNIGSIVIWRAQVSVNLIPSLQSSSSATAIRNAAGADCLTSVSGAAAQPCASASGTSYISWERLPSYASSQANSTYWLSMPNVKLFTQMYTTESILLLTDGFHTGTQYYVCGS